MLNNTLQLTSQYAASLCIAGLKTYHFCGQSIKMKWIPYILLIAGIAVIHSAFTAHSDSITSEYWPYTDGEVISTQIIKAVTPAEHASTVYTAVIRYKYTVNAKEYINNTYSFGSTSYTRKEHAKNIIEPYKDKKYTKVYYSNTKPEFSVLVPGPNWGAFLLHLFFGMAFVTLGVFNKIISSWFLHNILHLK